MIQLELMPRDGSHRAANRTHPGKWLRRMKKERAAPKVKHLLEDVYMLAYMCRALCPGW